MWTVLIVEDDPETLEFFVASVSKSDQLAIFGCVGSVGEAKRLLSDPRQSVDVVVTDLGLPDGSGLEVIRYAKQRHPECESLVISMFGDDNNVLASIQAGALGYIHKDASPDDIANTIVEMKRGASLISPMIARRVLRQFQATLETTGTAPGANIDSISQPGTLEAAPSLSPREQEVLDLAARGFSYAEIARLHGISVHTVQTHIKNLYAKLSVHSRSEAVYEAGRLGLLQVDRH